MSASPTQRTAPEVVDPPVSGWVPGFVELDITRKCQLACTHCMVSASPLGTHGNMALRDWQRVITELADLGTECVQFIGGEPTLHPALPALIKFALARELEVEVFSNLVHVTDELWDLFCRPGVTLAASYYTGDRAQHEIITGGFDTHRQTTANIGRACQLGIPIRVGGVELLDDQKIDEAIRVLTGLGVEHVADFDRLRGVGRGAADPTSQVLDTAELCGHCTRDVLSVHSDGSVSLCMFTGSLPVGNVLSASLAGIIGSATMHGVFAVLADEFASRGSNKAGRICSPLDLNCFPMKTCKPKK